MSADVARPDMHDYFMGIALAVRRRIHEPALRNAHG